MYLHLLTSHKHQVMNHGASVTSPKVRINVAIYGSYQEKTKKTLNMISLLNKPELWIDPSMILKVIIKV